MQREVDGMEVTLIGMGGAGPDALTAAAAAALRSAARVVGATRLLDGLGPDVTASRVPATRPADVLAAILAGPGPCAVLYSGDTGFYSGSAGLLPLLKERGITARVLPGLSSVQLLAAALGRPWQDWTLCSAHGTACDPVAAVCGGKPAFFLTGGRESGPAALCARLAAVGLGSLQVTVGERLSYPDQRIVMGTAAELAGQVFAHLSVLLAEAAPRRPARTPGWPDETFARAESVPMTKQAIRAQILARMALRPGETVWDVGAGTGSVSLELAFANGGAPVWAVERLPAACALIEENRRRLGGWNVQVVKGEAPDALTGLPAPDAVFIGGTRGALGPVLDAVFAANPAARVCLTAIALETLSTALAELTGRGLTVRVDQIGTAHAGPAGRLHLLRAENPVFLITAEGGTSQ